MFAVYRRVCTCGSKPGLTGGPGGCTEGEKKNRMGRRSVIYHVIVFSDHLGVDIGLAADVLSPERSEAGDLGVNLTHRLGGGAGGKGGDAK